MGKPNKFETAVKLDTKAKRELYLSQIIDLDLDCKEMTDYIDTVKLASEYHPKELLLSKKWQKGYELSILRTQKIIFEILIIILTDAKTTLDAAAKLSIGGDIIDELSLNSLIKEKDRRSLLDKLVQNTDKVDADAHCMYDPETHPDSGKSIEGGKEQLFYWTNEKIEKSA